MPLLARLCLVSLCNLFLWGQGCRSPLCLRLVTGSANTLRAFGMGLGVDLLLCLGESTLVNDIDAESVGLWNLTYCQFPILLRYCLAESVTNRDHTGDGRWPLLVI